MTATATKPTQYPLGTTVLNGRGIGVEIGGKTILEDVDIELRIGEVVAVVGPNGAGKSTLLTALAGDRPASGEVIIDDKPLSAWPAAELARKRAVLRQDNGLSFPFTVLEVVKMGRAPWTRITTPEEDERIIATEMVRTDVMQFASRSVPSLSGGERARVSLARVLTQRTPVLMLDEPTAALDVNYQEQVLALVRQTARAGCAVVVVLHDLAAAGAYCDKLLLLDNGKARAFGPPAEVLTSELLSEVYGHPIRVTHHPDNTIGVEPVRFADDIPAQLLKEN